MRLIDIDTVKCQWVRTGSALAFLCILALSPVEAQWENPSERYADAYLQFVDAPCPLPRDEAIAHFVYFARDREAMRGHAFLEMPRISGAQIMYPWRALEPNRGVYDFSSIEDDLQYLSAHGKTLFIQLQDATFSPHYTAVPEYLFHDEFGGGVLQQRTDEGELEGWVAKRWNGAVQERFAQLLSALGEAFDRRVAGVNLQESAIEVMNSGDPTFTPAGYVAGIKANMSALHQAFPHTTTMQYANFMPGEWLPWEDNGYLREIYAYGERIGVGLGAPDLMVRRKGQLNHALAMMHEGEFRVPLGIAVQDGNYIGETGNMEIRSHRENIVPLLYAFAKEFLGVSYIFWSYQEPYFHEDLLPCFGDR